MLGFVLLLVCMIGFVGVAWLRVQLVRCSISCVGYALSIGVNGK